MTDKIKLKADKFVNDKKLKLNYIKPKDLKILLAEFCEEQIAGLEKENTELKKINTHTLSQLNLDNGELIIENEKLRKENAELKKEWQEQVQKATDEGYARTLQTMQLTKAKDHIKKLLGCLQQDTNDPQTNYYVVQYMTEAEQFLNSEVGK